MQKRIGILCAMAIMIGIPLAAKASEASDTAIQSYGNFFYESADGSVRFYSEDLALLQEKLSSVPDEIFDPALYSPRRYGDAAEQSHDIYTPEKETPYTVFDAPSHTSDFEGIITEEKMRVTGLGESEALDMDMDMEAEEDLQPESEKTEENMATSAPEVTSAPDVDELPEISVSGNDCVDDNGTKKGGENNL